MHPALLTSNIPSDPSGWWLSIKYDGIRTIWTGSRLITRHGRPIAAPQWFVAGLPAHRLDGELWKGNQSFNALVSVVQRKDGDWRGARFMVFDLAEGGTFEDRMKRLENIPLPAHAIRVLHRRCDGAADLDATERDVVAEGGEGLVIRRPGCLYRPGRMGDVIKVKRLTKDVDRWQG
jgi:DNA ligase-1